MAFPKILSDAAVSAAKGISKVVLHDLLQSVEGNNRGVIVPYRSEGNRNIICFVHGFCGEPGSTFSPLPDFIIEEQELKGWDILSIGYSTDLMPNIGKGLWAASPDINRIAKYLQTNLEIIFDKYDRVALIGHSMGGLAVQRALLNMKDIHKVSHVLFFGTPSGGLKKARFLRWFKNQIADMDYEGDFIKDLRKEWDEKFKHGYDFRFTTVAGELDEFVPVRSSVEPFPEEYRSYTSGNHVSMVKPMSVDDTSFRIIKQALSPDLADWMKGFDYRKLNNQIAIYSETINKMEKNEARLDKKGLREYIFALEGTGRIDDAIKTIESSEVIKTNTDFMGILGGRWKRKYLIENIEEYLQKSISWYNKALELSKVQNNNEQIYYHAINLAFLYLMEDDKNRAKSKEMAQLTLDHYNLSKEEDVWKTATLAEANLYLHQFEESKRLYAKAVKGFGSDIRAIGSMMINAIYACSCFEDGEQLQKDLLQIFLAQEE